MIHPLLVVEDDPKIARVVSLYLEQAGYRVVVVGSGREALEAAAKEKPLLVVLDLMLPDIGGEQVIQNLVGMGDVPVIILTSKSSEEDRVAGFALGADDYVVKPFSPRELVQRVKAVLKRAHRDDLAAAEAVSFERGALVLDGHRYEVKHRGTPVNLTPSEFKVFFAQIGSLTETFNRMAQALRSLEALRRKLLTNLAHEFRTPLSAISGELEGMMDGLIPAGKEELRSLHEEAGRLKRMMDGCEELALAQASAATLARERIQLRTFLGHVLERAFNALGDKKVNLQLECPEDLTVDVDPDRLTQILVNLLDNAIKASGNAGNVTVRAMSEGHNVVLHVEDGGAGIEASIFPSSSSVSTEDRPAAWASGSP